jgi:hypothetical protein
MVWQAVSGIPAFAAIIHEHLCHIFIVVSKKL